MAFESLTEKLSATFKRLRGKGRLSEADVKQAMKEIKMALLEADVNFKVVKNFVATVSERAVGADVMESLTPAQMIVKIVNEELTALMGSGDSKLAISSTPPTVVMLVGLQGAGKTTNGAKLAGLMKKQGKRPLLAACDIYRPAAIQQLEVVGAQLDIPVFQMGQTDPVDIAKAAVEHARTRSTPPRPLTRRWTLTGSCSPSWTATPGAAPPCPSALSPASPSNLLAQAKSWTILRYSILTGWPAAFWAWEMCSP